MTNNRRILTSLFLTALIIRLIAAVVYLNFDSHAISLDRKPFLNFVKESSDDVWSVVGDRDKYNTLARDIIAYGDIGNGFGRPPLYSIFLAISYSVFGFNHFGFFIPQIILASVSSVLIFCLAQRMFDKRIAIMAGLFYIFNPHFILSSIQLYAETLYFFLLLSLFLSCQRLLSGPLPRHALYTGIFMGLAALCRTTFLVFAPFILIWVIAVFHRQRRQMLILIPIVVVSFLVIYAGQIKRDYSAFRYIFYNTNSRNDWKIDDLCEATEDGKYSDRYIDGESTFLNWARENPKQYFNRSARQLKIFLFEPCAGGVSFRHRVVSAFIFFTIYPLGCLGIIKSLRERKRIALLILLFIASTSVFYILTFIDGELRYRLPVELFISIFAAYGLNLVGNIKGGGNKPL